MKHLFFLLYLLFCSLCDGDCQSPAAIKAIDSIRVVMMNHARSNTLASVADLYASNAVIDGFDTRVEGIEAIRKYWSSIRGKGINWEWEINSLTGTDELLFQTGVSYLTLGYGDRILTYSTVFNVTWERQENGSYKIVQDFYRANGQQQVKSVEIVRDSVFVVTATDTLFGYVFKPKAGGKKFPAVLCLQGGGDVGLENYLLEAEFFASQGFIAAIFDKSGSGKSTGKSSWITQTFEEKVIEYSRLFHWLQGQSFVNPAHVGISGLSEGGRLALAVGLQHPEKVAFINSVSAPLESYKENQLYAIRQLLVSRGFSESVIVESSALFEEYFDAVAVGTIPGYLVEKIEAFKKKNPGQIYLPNASTQLPRMPQQGDIHYSLGNGKELSVLTCPILFQYGSSDAIVNVKRSMALIPSKKHFTVHHYMRTDHSMNMENGELHPRYLRDKKMWLEEIVLK